MILIFHTNRSRQTVQTRSSLIRVFTACYSTCISLMKFPIKIWPLCLNFRLIRAKFSVIQKFRNFRVITMKILVLTKRNTSSNNTSSTTTLRLKFLSNYQFVEKSVRQIHFSSKSHFVEFLFSSKIVNGCTVSLDYT